jgi:MFS transporter, DHA2 family, multidrug resistance protein
MDEVIETNEQAPPQKAGLREWIGLSVLALACILYVMDLTVLHLAVPSLSAQLKPSSIELLWIIDIYGFMVAGFLVTMGTLGDRIGRRKLLLSGAATFGVISIIAAFSSSTGMLIASRALLGIAGATLAPSTLSLIFSMFKDPKQRSMAIAVWISSFSAGSAIGPVLGGVVLEHYWWGAVFLLAVPVMALLLILGPKVLPEYRDPKAGRLDILSAITSLAAILSVIYGVKHIAQDGVSIMSLSTIAIGIIIGFLFVKRQLHLKDPMIDLRLFAIRSFNISLIVNVSAVFVAFGYFLFVAQYLQLVLGLSPLEGGLWSVPSAVAFIVGSNVVPRVFHSIRPSIVIGVSLMLAAFGLVFLTQVGTTDGLVSVVAASVIISLGLAPVFGLTTELIVGSAPTEKAGAASGIAETASELGGALGISVLGSIGVAVYRGGISSLLPSGISDELKTTVNSTLGAALEAVDKIPAELQASVVSAAKSSFVDGMIVTSIVCIVVAVAASIMAFSLLGNVKLNENQTH